MDAVWERAIKSGNIQDIHDLLARGVDVDARDRYGQTALMLVAHAGHREAVELLIAHRASLNITAKYGLSALMPAIVAGHADVAHLLVDTGADRSLQGSGAPGFAGKRAYDPAVDRDMRELSAALKPKPESNGLGNSDTRPDQ